MNQVYKMALRYYPDRWNDTMLRNLVELGRLTKEEYKAVTGEVYVETHSIREAHNGKI